MVPAGGKDQDFVICILLQRLVQHKIVVTTDKRINSRYHLQKKVTQDEHHRNCVAHLRIQEAPTVGFKVSAMPLSKNPPENNATLHPVYSRARKKTQPHTFVCWACWLRAILASCFKLFPTLVDPLDEILDLPPVSLRSYAPAPSS